MRAAMKAETTLRRELARVQQAMRGEAVGSIAYAEQYGAMQALTWALGEPNTAAPHTLARSDVEVV